MLKKLFCVIIVFAVVCSLTGCGFLRREKEIDPKRSPHRYVDKVLQDMEDYLKEGDAENLHKLIAKGSRATVEEVQGLLDFIDGEIVSFDKESLQPNGGTVKYGEYLKYAYGGRFNISTSNGKEYECHFAGYVVNDEKPEKVGLEYIAIVINNNGSINGYGAGLGFNEKGQPLDFGGNVTDW
ncbi:MAG: DUF5104 domain-containing protein [Oscillospiraceae bacterium]|nr:DUF5104 domain-containing protein [Oscillospiraceae bacterium]